MKSVLLLPFIKVENANAINGFTHGFPAISSFLGFVHAISRKLKISHNLSLGGCGVICHQYHLQAYRPSKWADYSYSLSRNPLTKDAKPPAFVEEGRMHLTVSLTIECDFIEEDFDEDKSDFETYIMETAISLRLAGGTIIEMGKPEFISLPRNEEKRAQKTREIKRKLLPGFALIDRSDYLEAHLKQLQINNPSVQMIDAWLDFAALKSTANKPNISSGELVNNEHPSDWSYNPKPFGGWLIPITSGYKAISDLYQPGQVDKARDPEMPFRFVESVHTIGEWLSPHRIQDIKQIIWRYDVMQNEGWYLCKNNFSLTNSNNH